MDWTDETIVKKGLWTWTGNWMKGFEGAKRVKTRTRGKRANPFFAIVRLCLVDSWPQPVQGSMKKMRTLLLSLFGMMTSFLYSLFSIFFFAPLLFVLIVPRIFRTFLGWGDEWGILYL